MADVIRTGNRLHRGTGGAGGTEAQNANNERQGPRRSSPLVRGNSGTVDSKNKTPKRHQRSALDGGYEYQDVDQWVNAYKAANADDTAYENGFSTEMNRRSMANFIRQQMKANSDAWAGAGETERQYLHNQNLELAKILKNATGGVESTFNENLGRWETNSGDFGYGYNLGAVHDPEWKKQYYGLTDEDMERYANDTSRYYNFVSDGHRAWIDESNGYTGPYAEFVNGPYAEWMAAGALGRPNRETYQDLIGDGFHDELDYYEVPKQNADGGFDKHLPYLKGGNASDYTQGKAAYVEDGVIMPGMLDRQRVSNLEQNMWANGGNPVADTGDNYGVRKLNDVRRGIYGGGGAAASYDSPSNGSGANSYEAQINELYDSQLRAQIAQLEAAYNESIADLDRSLIENADLSREQSRAQAAQAEKDMAGWREVANAQGYNSGAIGQSALVSASALQSSLNAIESEQAAKRSEIERQRALAAQSFQMQIRQAQADNDYARVQALLQEAQRVDEALREQAQFESQQMMNYLQMMM